MCVYLVLVAGAFFVLGGEFTVCWIGYNMGSGMEVVRGGMGSVALMYSWGGSMLVTSAWVLLLTLLVVLELTRGTSRGEEGVKRCLN